MRITPKMLFGSHKGEIDTIWLKALLAKVEDGNEGIEKLLSKVTNIIEYLNTI